MKTVTTISICIKPETADRLRAQAEAYGMTVSAYVNFLIIQGERTLDRNGGIHNAETDA